MSLAINLLMMGISKFSVSQEDRFEIDKSNLKQFEQIKNMRCLLSGKTGLLRGVRNSLLLKFLANV